MSPPIRFRPGAVLGEAFRAWNARLLRLHLIVFAICLPLAVAAILLSKSEAWPILWTSDGFLGLFSFSTDTAIRFQVYRAFTGRSVGDAVMSTLQNPAVEAGLLALVLQFVATGAVISSLARAPGLVFRSLRVVVLAVLAALFMVTVDVLLMEALVGRSVILSANLVVVAASLMGLALATLLWMSVPITMLEGCGVLRSMARSLSLTRGFRFQVLSLVLFAVLLQLVAVYVLSAILPENWGRDLAARLVVGVVMPVLKGCLLWAAYTELRAVKGGPRPEPVDTVFE